MIPEKLDAVKLENQFDAKLLEQPQGFVAWLVNLIKGDRERVIKITVKPNHVYRFGVKPTLQILSYDAGEAAVTLPTAIVVNFHDYQNTLNSAGVYLAGTEELSGGIRVYTLRYRGFHDLVNGAFVDEVPVRPEPVDNPFVSPAYFHKSNTTWFGGAR